MSAETLALLALEKGVEVGAVGFKEARELFKETWQRAFPDYDVEKVFFRCAYTAGGLILAKIIYNIYYQLRLLTVKPLEFIEELMGKKIFENITVNTTLAIVKIIAPKAAEEAQEDWLIRQEEERRKLLEELGIPIIVDDIFNKHLPLVIAGSCGWWIFSEYQSYKKLKALTTKIL